MANTGRIAGKDLYVSFGGVDVSGDFTTITVREEGDLVDVTAGADAYHYYITLRKDGTIDYRGFYDGATETVWDAIAVLTAGTLIIGPKGTTATYPKWTWNRAIVQSRGAELPFDNAVTVDASFQMSSTCTEGTW